MSATPGAASLFRAALQRERLAVGTWVKVPAVEVAELLALAGMDFVVIDLEHSPVGTESMFALIGAARLSGVAPLVRVPGLDPGLIQRVLDAGAEGIMVPHVDTVEQAERAAAAVRFPPRGTRGVGSTSRAGDWGALPLAEYLRRGQEEVVLIAQIESAHGVAEAGAIAAVDGVDALLLGLADLSVGEQLPPDDPAVVDLVRRCVLAASEAGVPIGNAGPPGRAAADAALAQGFSFTMLGNDAGLLRQAASDAVIQARAAARATTA